MLGLKSRGFPLVPYYGPLPSFKGSELWAPVFKVVYNGIKMGLQGFRLSGHTRGPSILFWRTCLRLKFVDGVSLGAQKTSYIRGFYKHDFGYLLYICMYMYIYIYMGLGTRMSDPHVYVVFLSPNP